MEPKNLSRISKTLFLKEQQLERKVNDGETKGFCHPANNPPWGIMFTETREIY